LPYQGELVLGWGRKWSGQRAVAIAAAEGKEFQLVEDGFLRSVARLDNALSLVLDSSGIYYDATAPSQLEILVAQPLSPTEQARARSIMATWRAERLSKYNAQREFTGVLPKRYVLVCDQSAGDASISHGLADADSFSRMLDAALVEYPDHQIIVKTHPDVATCGRAGHFDISALCAQDRIQIVSAPAHPVRLLEHADAVYTVTSQLGFEAMIWGKPVRCFGMPFYAGWGLTNDEMPAPDRRKPATLEQLVHSALVKYPNYINPVTMQRCKPERVFEHVGLQRRKRFEFTGRITAVGFSRWKRPFIECFLQGSQVSFVKRSEKASKALPGAAVAVWGSATAPAMQGETQVLRIEDGFLRSSGLGADLVRPLSLVVDDLGIYYDATRPSRLEHILESQSVTREALARAGKLRQDIVQLDITKYNLGQASWTRPENVDQVLLVVGQVETDASIRLGSPEVKSNIDLLKRVRQENPSAHIVYKPHPDVLAGLRKRGMGEDKCHNFADEILTAQVSLGQLLSQIDEVHTMTSLIGFEALIRGAKVVCHGLPFYAGWGVTEDKIQCPRRTRSLKIDELVYGALITYPRYFDYERSCYVEPENVVDRLAALAKNGPSGRTWTRKALRLSILAWLKLKGSDQ